MSKDTAGQASSGTRFLVVLQPQHARHVRDVGDQMGVLVRLELFGGVRAFGDTDHESATGIGSFLQIGRRVAHRG